MDKSKKRAYEIIETYIEKAKDLEFVDSIYLVGSLSDDTYTGNPGSDIDLVHIVSDDVDYPQEKAEIVRIVEETEQQTDNDIAIARVVFQNQHLRHPYKYDFELSQENMDLVNRPIEVFRILDAGKLLFGKDFKEQLERPTRVDIVESERMQKRILFDLKEKDPAFYEQYTKMHNHPTLRMLTQTVLTTAMSDYLYYTDKSCSSKYYILERIEQGIPDFKYLNLLRLCHKNRFDPKHLTEQEKQCMYDEYTNVFLTKPDTWLSDNEDMRNEYSIWKKLEKN